jgi:hypothetical protein
MGETDINELTASHSEQLMSKKDLIGLGQAYKYD